MFLGDPFASHIGRGHRAGLVAENQGIIESCVSGDMSMGSDGDEVRVKAGFQATYSVSLAQGASAPGRCIPEQVFSRDLGAGEFRRVVGGGGDPTDGKGASGSYV